MKKVLFILFLLALSLVFFTLYYRRSQEIEARSSIYSSFKLFEKKKYNKALHGSYISYGFLDNISLFPNTSVRNNACLLAGICFIKLNQYGKGIQYLLAARITDKIMRARVFSFIGDAYMHIGDYDNALKFYFDAAAVYDNDADVPIYLFKAVKGYEKKAEYDKANKLLNKILEKYRECDFYSDFVEEKKKIELVIRKDKEEKNKKV